MTEIIIQTIAIIIGLYIAIRCPLRFRRPRSHWLAVNMVNPGGPIPSEVKMCKVLEDDGKGNLKVNYNHPQNKGRENE